MVISNHLDVEESDSSTPVSELTPGQDESLDGTVGIPYIGDNDPVCIVGIGIYFPPYMHLIVNSLSKLIL
jgi:hypothetical protein